MYIFLHSRSPKGNIILASLKRNFLKKFKINPKIADITVQISVVIQAQKLLPAVFKVRWSARRIFTKNLPRKVLVKASHGVSERNNPQPG